MTKITYLHKDNFTFFKEPKFLRKSKYANLTASARSTYSVLLNLWQTAKYVSQSDSSGNFYVTIPDDKLAKAVGVSSRTISSIKNTLEDVGLIWQKRMGFCSKNGKNLPNRIYLLQPSNLDDSDFISNKNNGNDDHSENNADPDFVTRTSKKADKPVDNKQNNGSAKISDILELQNINKNKISIDSTSEKSKLSIAQKEKDILNTATLSSFGKTVADCFDDTTLNLIKLLSSDLKQANHIFAIIFKAKSLVEKEFYQKTKKIVPLELSYGINETDDDAHDLRHSINETLQHVINRFKLNKVKNLSAYLFKCLKKNFWLQTKLQADLMSDFNY